MMKLVAFFSFVVFLTITDARLVKHKREAQQAWRSLYEAPEKRPGTDSNVPTKARSIEESGLYQDIWLLLNKALVSQNITKTEPNGKGKFENCGKTIWDASWDPEPMLMNKYVHIKGKYTFPEDFTEGIVKVTVGSYPTQTLPILCSQIVKTNDCRKGNTIVFEKSYIVPFLPVPKMTNVPLMATVTDKNGNQIVCAKANINIQ